MVFLRLGATRREAIGIGIALAGLVVPAAIETGCFLSDCPSTFHGLHGTETLQTTVIAPVPVTGDAGTPSCGALGDLVAGAVITSHVRFVGGAESCASGVDLDATALSTAMVTLAAGVGARVQLPSGCTGTMYLALVPMDPNGDASFLDAAPDGGLPAWVLRRTFAGDSTSCATETASADCVDDFVASNAVVN